MTTDKLKKLVEAATPGPWVQSMPNTTWVMAGSLHVATIPRASDGDWSPQNARLIAAAPALAREVIALREAAGELADAAEQSYQAAHDYRVTSNAASAEASLRADQEFRTALATLRAVLGESE
jgi:hypothetical protein